METYFYLHPADGSLRLILSVGQLSSQTAHRRTQLSSILLPQLLLSSLYQSPQPTNTHGFIYSTYTVQVQ